MVLDFQDVSRSARVWAAIAVQALGRALQEQVRRCLHKAQTRAETPGIH